MKELLILLITISSYSQSGNYYFEFKENRTATGWDVVNTTGKVIFYSNENSEIVTIYEKETPRVFYVKSKLMYLRQDTFLYELAESNNKKSKLRIVTLGSLDNIDLYFYSDRKEEKYFRLRLKKIQEN
jgi:hypothetical protein